MKKSDIQKILELVRRTEEDIKLIRNFLLAEVGEDVEKPDLGSIQKVRSDLKKVSSAQEESDENVLYGFFDGEKMVGEDNKEYPIPPNYASKSRLVYGDKLKLMFSNGQPRFKPVELIERKWVIGQVVEKEGQYKIMVEEKLYNVLFASVTYYKLSPGDRVSAIIPATVESSYATIDSAMPNG